MPLQASREEIQCALRTGIERMIAAADRGQYIFLYYITDSNDDDDDDCDANTYNAPNATTATQQPKKYSVRGNIYRKLVRNGVPVLNLRWDAVAGQRVDNVKPAQEIDAESFTSTLLLAPPEVTLVSKVTLSNKSDGSRAVEYFALKNFALSSSPCNGSKTTTEVIADEQRLREEKIAAERKFARQQLHNTIMNQNGNNDDNDDDDDDQNINNNNHNNNIHFNNNANGDGEMMKQSMVSLSSKEGGKTECSRAHKKALQMYRSKLSFLENILSMPPSADVNNSSDRNHDTNGEERVQSATAYDENDPTGFDSALPVTAPTDEDSNRHRHGLNERQLNDILLQTSLDSMRIPLKSSDIFVLPAQLAKKDVSKNSAQSSTNPRYQRYLRGPKIGEGTFGHVFVAKDRRTNSAVAVKVLRSADHPEMGGLHNMIMRELTVARVAASPLLIPIDDVIFAGDGNVFFIMPLVHHDVTFLIRKGFFSVGAAAAAAGRAAGDDGNMFRNTKVPSLHSAQSYLAASSLASIRLPKFDVIQTVFGQLVEALDDLHRVRRVVHRDVKPSNVLIRSDGVVQLGDFGWSRMVAAEGGRQTGPPCGINYRPLSLLVSPKSQYDGEKLDIYGAGCIFYELLTSGSNAAPSTAANGSNNNASTVGSNNASGPLFQGRTEAEVATSILNVLGSPAPELVARWDPTGHLKVAQGYPVLLPRVLNQHHIDSGPARDLLLQMLDYDERKRPTAQQILNKEFFLGYQPVLPILRRIQEQEEGEFSSRSNNNDNSEKMMSRRYQLPVRVQQLANLLPANTVSNYWEFKQNEKKAEIDRIQKELTTIRRSGSESIGSPE